MTIVRVRKDPNDAHGDPSTDEPTRLTLTGAFVAPRSSSDVDDRGRDGVVVGLSLFGSYGVDILHTDQIEVDGVLYSIDGEIGQWKNPLTGWEAGSEVALKRAAG